MLYIMKSHTFDDGSTPYSNVFIPTSKSLTQSITSSTSTLKFA